MQTCRHSGMPTYTGTHAGMHTCIDQYRSIDRFIAPSIYLSIPPSAFRCVSACTLKGSGIHTIVQLPVYPRAGRVCASAIRRRSTPLHFAAWSGHAAVAAALLTHGADVNAKDKYRCVLPVAISGNGRRAPRWTLPAVTGPMQCSSGRTDGHARDARMHTDVTLRRTQKRLRSCARTHRLQSLTHVCVRMYLLADTHARSCAYVFVDAGIHVWCMRLCV